MTVIFRVILVIVSILTMAFMMRKIRQAKVQIEAALFWVIMALILVVFSLFPAVADACAHLLGIYSTPNFLFLFMIFLLIVKSGFKFAGYRLGRCYRFMPVKLAAACSMNKEYWK